MISAERGAMSFYRLKMGEFVRMSTLKAEFFRAARDFLETADSDSEIRLREKSLKILIRRFRRVISESGHFVFEYACDSAVDSTVALIRSRREKAGPSATVDNEILWRNLLSRFWRKVETAKRSGIFFSRLDSQPDSDSLSAIELEIASSMTSDPEDPDSLSSYEYLKATACRLLCVHDPRGLLSRWTLGQSLQSIADQEGCTFQAVHCAISRVRYKIYKDWPKSELYKFISKPKVKD